MANPKQPEAVAPLQIVPMMLPTNVPEQLARARFVAPATIELEFVDGRRFALAVELLAKPVNDFFLDRMDWQSLEVSPDGDKIIVKRIKGGPIPIDSASFRYLVDEKYAARIVKSISALHMTPTEAEEASGLSKITRDPRWSEVGDEGDLFE